jgi:hypothetical protein
MKTRITVEQLEQMKTHELADLLGNVALLLKRMPDVECGQLIRQNPGDEVFLGADFSQRAHPTLAFTQAGLQKKKLEELKKIADSLFISYSGRIRKDDLVSKILARPAHGHSEQFAIQDL